MNPKKELHPKQKELLDYIIAYKTRHDGTSPTFREMRDALDVSTTSLVSYRLDRLEYLGYIKRPAYNKRSIQVVGGEWRYR